VCPGPACPTPTCVVPRDVPSITSRAPRCRLPARVRAPVPPLQSSTSADEAARPRTRQRKITAGAHSHSTATINLSQREARLGRVLNLMQIELRSPRTPGGPPCTP